MFFNKKKNDNGFNNTHSFMLIVTTFNLALIFVMIIMLLGLFFDQLNKENSPHLFDKIDTLISETEKDSGTKKEVTYSELLKLKSDISSHAATVGYYSKEIFNQVFSVIGGIIALIALISGVVGYKFIEYLTKEQIEKHVKDQINDGAVLDNTKRCYYEQYEKESFKQL